MKDGQKDKSSNINNMASISFYGSHNAAYAVEVDGKIELILEVERFLNYKNSGIAQYKTARPEDILFLSKHIVKHITKVTGIEEFDICYALNTDVITDKRYNLEKHIPAKEYRYSNHHQSHAAGSFYQSSYKEALIFSFDGGANDGKFNIYKASRENSVELIERVLSPNFDRIFSIDYDLGFPYMVFGHFLSDIRLETLDDGNLVYPGKLMGLASYGKIIKKWLPHFINFYKSDPQGTTYQEKLNELGSKINIEFDHTNRIGGETGYNIAATSQKAFETCFLEVAKPYLDKYTNIPVIITGGCGLNIILNTKLVEEFDREVFVGPNPNDCGIAAGMLLHELKPEHQVDLTYKGTPLLDYNNLASHIQNSPISFKSFDFNLDVLVNDLVNGEIVGVVRGNSEHGPRALGNRSILCDPSFPEMKKILNEKVKNREWYRPFAPVVRLEDISKYFEWESESRWMSFCPQVKKEWQTKLASIVHIDGTARVQTVTRHQNPWLYDLLTEMDYKKGIGVLLNTSFNVAGKPILSTIADAFKIFEVSQMDNLLVENYYIKKNYVKI